MIGRTELRSHTKMGQMNSIADARELVRKAKEMGLSAIAITDNNTVQALPAAYDEYKCGADDGFKIIYGCEMNLIDDGVKTVIENKKNRS